MAQETLTKAAAGTALIHRMLDDEEAGWSVGTFGAIAEFHHVEGDPPARPQLTPDGGDLVTAAGGMRIKLSDSALPVAFEGLSKRASAWTHSVTFCLPLDAARRGQRAVLTELGPDADALRDEDREAVLFDMGVGAPHIDFCVRTSEPELVETLRRCAGQSIFIKESAAMAAIKAHSPNRVCMSNLGRVEVYNGIPGNEPGATSPAGPHTHLLPKLLKAGQTHSANTPAPDGWVPAFDLHPRSCFSDRMGRPRAFDRAAFEAFQNVVEAFAPSGYTAEKKRIRDAVNAGLDPSAYKPAETRTNRRASRVALRQMLQTESERGNVESWLGVFEPARDTGDAHADGH